MDELVYTDAQLDAMSQDELKAEYRRTQDKLNDLWNNFFAFRGYRLESYYRFEIDRHYRRYGNLVARYQKEFGVLA